jgi:RNA polymerase sigma-70 factor (ECF subfamily)
MVAQISSSVSTPSKRSAADRAARNTVSRQEALLDAVLVRRFNAGDQAAFVEIFTRYRDRMLHVALGLLRNRADAEEIAQDTFIRAHRGLANFRGDSSLSAWLHCITLNLSRNRYWYFFRRRRHATQSLDCAVSADNQATYADLVASDAPSPVREAATREFSALVAECMTKLSASQYEILRLRNVQQYSYRAIAQTLGISVGTVKSRIGRARENLRMLLAKTYPEFDPDASPSEWFDPARPSGRHEVVCA